MFNSVAIRQISLVLLCLFIVRCSHKENSGKATDQLDSLVEQDAYKPLPKNLKEEDVIFYNIFTPSDVSTLIDESNSFYKSSLINPLLNITKYNESSTVALNLGVYGADLNYLWVFKQSQQALSYVSAIQRLSAQLSIPQEFVEINAKNAEKYTNNVDSLKSIARRVYHESNVFLKQSGRGNSAVLILLGGWVESLYIALSMYNEPDARMMSKIATQKFSLSIIINMLQNQQDDMVAAEYLLLLKKLKKAFDDFEIHVNPDSIVIDSANKYITIKNDGKTSFDPKQLEDIRTVTARIRNRMVN